MIKPCGISIEFSTLLVLVLWLDDIEEIPLVLMPSPAPFPSKDVFLSSVGVEAGGADGEAGSRAGAPDGGDKLETFSYRAPDVGESLISTSLIPLAKIKPCIG